LSGLSGEDERLELKLCQVYENTLCPVADRCSLREVKGEVCFCCADEVRRVLSEEGFFVAGAGRATFVAFPDCLEALDGENYAGLKIVVFSDPDSGICRKDEIFITGFRFGLSDIVLNGFPLYSAFSDYGYDIRYALARLMAEIHCKFHEDEGKKQRLLDMVSEIGRELNCHVDHRYEFNNTYLTNYGPRRILIVSERDSCRGPIARAALEKLVDEKGLEICVDSAAYRNPEKLEDDARVVIQERYGVSVDHIPKSVEELKFGAGWKKVLDYDLIIALEEEFRKGLPEQRTVTLKEISGKAVTKPESLEECFRAAEELEEALRRGMERILDMLYR